MGKAWKVKPIRDPKKIESIERTKWILNIPFSPQDWRGLEAEKNVIGILERFKRKKIEFPGGRVIEEVISTLHYSPDDSKGIDIKVKFQDSEVLYIQVQNWDTWGTKEKFKKKGICLIVFRTGEDKIKGRKRILADISEFLRTEQEIYF